MLSSLLRQKKSRLVGNKSPLSSPYIGEPISPMRTRRGYLSGRQGAAGFEESEVSGDEDAIENDGNEGGGEVDGLEDEDGVGESTPLLPIFSAAHLDALPVYNLTHAIRLLVIARCETTLTWDQLRSPQVSQFLVKPIQQEIRTSHFSRSTLYALMANCLQFNKEMQMNPGNSGVSRTRAMVCELLDIKLLKEYTTRELIDALSYDFDPLQGQSRPGTATATAGPNRESNHRAKIQPRQARISCLEIAIRATAKRFLAHPLVVQHLEAIWKGTLVFHSAADNLHRPPIMITPNKNRGYGTTSRGDLRLDTSPRKPQPAEQHDRWEQASMTFRRSVTIYDPRDASLFKLSRLRVPRYRQFLSTCSFAILLGLFVAVLAEKSLVISALEVVFWFWSAGFMLDEIVGFNEQGFSLYIMSFWNTFDIGILLLLVCYYCLRLYGIIMPDLRKHIANMAYDVLAANAVLLFPRLFSVMDHSRYFSQLLVAFRMMASDLVAVFILIMISCSGFFVCFTLSFGNTENDSPSAVAYGLFQMLMGFTPAAWDRWGKYNLLGKSVLTLFLFICHFLIVTILVTVLTNSFMAIAQNANDEHQFVFAVNTISMVKSDALFSYIAPTNVLAWVLTPLRYVVPFRKYVQVNRTAIKITHFPILFLIYAYERTFLRAAIVVPSDAVEPHGQGGKAEGEGQVSQVINVFSPQLRRLREPSITTYRKDHALDEVFRRPFTSTVRDTTKSRQRRKTSNVVNSWMQGLGPEGVASPPVEQDQSILDRLEHRRSTVRRSQILRRGATRDFTSATRSVASDPEEFMNNDQLYPDRHFRPPKPSPGHISQQTDGDGDDELVTNDNEDDENISFSRRASTLDLGNRKPAQQIETKDYFNQAPAARLRAENYATRSKTPLKRLGDGEELNTSPSHRIPRHHSRQISTATILYKPIEDKEKPEEEPPSFIEAPPPFKSNSTSASRTPVGVRTPVRKPVAGETNLSKVTSALESFTPSGRRTPKRPIPGAAARARPVMPPKSAAGFQSVPNLAGLVSLPGPRRRGDSSLVMDLGSDLGDNKAIGGGFIGAIPNSFATQMAYATGALRRRRGTESGEDERRMGKLVLARMGALEEGFREVLQEVRHMRKEGSWEGGSRNQSRLGAAVEEEIERGRYHVKRAKGSKEKSREKQQKRDEKGKRTRSEEEWVDEELLQDEGEPVQGKGSPA